MSSEQWLREQRRQGHILDEENRTGRCVSLGKTTPPLGILDAIAERKLTGGWNPNRICPSCNLALTELGRCPDSCGYTEAPLPRTPRRQPRPKDWQL